MHQTVLRLPHHTAADVGACCLQAATGLPHWLRVHGWRQESAAGQWRLVHGQGLTAIPSLLHVAHRGGVRAGGRRAESIVRAKRLAHRWRPLLLVLLLLRGWRWLLVLLLLLRGWGLGGPLLAALGGASAHGVSCAGWGGPPGCGGGEGGLHPPSAPPGVELAAGAHAMGMPGRRGRAGRRPPARRDLLRGGGQRPPARRGARCTTQVGRQRGATEG